MARPRLGLAGAAWACALQAAAGRRHIVKTIADVFFKQPEVVSKRPDTLEIIGAGASRTGTQSITEALSILGYPVYNMLNIAQNDHIAETTAALLDPSAAPALFERVLDVGLATTLDTPMNLLWKEQMDYFPKAKVLLSVRDNTEVWAKSFLWAAEAFSPFTSSRPWKWIVDLEPMFDAIGERINNASGGEEMGCVKHQIFVRPWWAPWVEYLDQSPQTVECVSRYYERTNELVRQTVPPERLLEFNVKQGWEPLCRFLNVSVPDRPFPNVNSTREVVLGYWFFRIVCWTYPLFVLLPLLLLACCCCRGSKQKAKDKEA